MADNPKELTTEELLIQLGRVVMGLGTKIDSLGEKLDTINQSLAGQESQAIDLNPLLEKMDELKTVLQSSPSVSVDGEGEKTVQTLDLEPLLSKIDELKAVLDSSSAQESQEGSRELDMNPMLAKMDELKEVLQAAPGDQQSPEGLDLQPMLDKLEEIRVLVEKADPSEQLKESFDSLSQSVEKLPDTVTDKFADKLQPVTDGITELKKAAEDRKFVEDITEKVEKLDETIRTSGQATTGAIGELPGKLEEMGRDISDSIQRLQEKTSDVLEKAEESLEKTDEGLKSVKEELQKGLKLNTDMTGQMVELTSRFADRAEEDRVSELNSRAVEHYSRGEYAEADKLFTEALAISPGDPELLCNSASVLAAMDDMEKAEQNYRKALAEAPELEPALSGLGMVMVKIQRAQETIEFLKSTILSGKPSVRTTIAYTRALAALERHDEAVELLENALKAAPDDEDIKTELSGYGYQGE